MKESSQYLTVHQFCEKHRAFSESSLRWLIFCAKTRKFSSGTTSGNGFKEAFVRVGRRVYIIENRFFELIDSMNSD